ncbi:hypothetical protein HY065_00480 [Candidatus Berkelbacteria bacterium]|nr:hypothetical protein [Candidatus Berkelbacteria bacterium]
MGAVRHYHHNYRFSYLTSRRRHFGLLGIVLIALVVIVTSVFNFITPAQPLGALNQFSLVNIASRSLCSFLLNLIFRRVRQFLSL